MMTKLTTTWDRTQLRLKERALQVCCATSDIQITLFSSTVASFYAFVTVRSQIPMWLSFCFFIFQHFQKPQNEWENPCYASRNTLVHHKSDCLINALQLFSCAFGRRRLFFRTNGSSLGGFGRFTVLFGEPVYQTFALALSVNHNSGCQWA